MHFVEDKIYIEGVNNKRIHIKKFVPLSYKRVFIVFHGICEHSGRYQNLADYFLKKSTALYLVDHRGHGLSEGTRGYIGDIDHFVQDMNSAINFIKKSEKKSIFIVAHSMGALLVTYSYLLNKQNFDSISGIILSSPAYRVKDLPESLENTLIKISKLLNNFYVRSIKAPEKFINDPVEVEKYKNDELIVRRLSPRFYTELTKAMSYCSDNIERFTIPSLFLISGHDNIIDAGTILTHYQRIDFQDKSKIIHQNSFHELFNDLYRNKIFSDIYLWVAERTRKESLFRKIASLFSNKQ